MTIYVFRASVIHRRIASRQCMENMSEEENSNVTDLVQPSETETSQTPASKPSTESSTSSADHNWKEARRTMEEQNRRIRELETQLYQPRAPETPDRDELEDLGQNDYLTRKQAEALAVRKAQELMEQQQYVQAEDRARIKYRDYDDVVTEDNVKELTQDEDVLRTLKSSPDPYAAAYKLIKNSTFYSDKNKKPSIESEKMAKNIQKPVSSNAVAQRPLAAANAYAFGSDAERQALWSETVQAARRR